MACWKLSEGVLKEGDRPVLTGVSAGFALAADPRGVGCFLSVGAEGGTPRQRFSAVLGRLPDLDRFTACRQADDPFWMLPVAGDDLARLPNEVQWFLGRLNDGRCLLIVPLFDDAMRFALEGVGDGTLAVLGETGDVRTLSAGGLALFVALGDDPYELLPDAAASVMQRLGTGKLRRQKKLPAFADCFGWCTWDAFYGDVSQEKVRDGLRSFAALGLRPRVLILDDGWQQTQPAPYGGKRLSGFDANGKFPGGLKETVAMAKQEFGIETMIVWHAVNGYWGGVDNAALPGYGAVDTIPRGGRHVNVQAVQDWQGHLIGVLPPKRVRKFYADYHAHLRAQGVDGVKIDNQGSLQFLGDNLGGRVRLFAAFRDAMERSTRKSFDAALINCMAHPTETWYHAPHSNLIRTSTDFWPKRPESHGLHLYTNAQVCAWFGEFMLGDWDMFQSAHPMGAYHAAGRAVSGAPVYVSDKPDGHDAALLRKLVCSDGRVLRCLDPGRPTPDCLYQDPTREDVLLKIFNRNRHGWVVGVFNARWHADDRARTVLAGKVSPADVPGIRGAGFALYAHHARSLLHITKREWGLAVTLLELGSEVVTLAPVVAGVGVIGLTDMLNSSGAITAVEREGRVVRTALCDGGDFGAWCAAAPARVRVDGAEAVFEFDAETGLLTVAVPDGPHTVEIEKA